MALQCGRQRGGIEVAGDTDEAGHLLVAHLQNLVEHAAFSFDLGEVLFLL